MNPQPNVLEVHTNDSAILHWEDFSIYSGETTKFVQPNAQSIVLNRVVSTNRSDIFGNLSADGLVYLINPSGILIGKTAQIHTGTFVASTLDIHDKAFLQQKKLHFMGSSKEPIIHLGRIKARDGSVYLIGFHVENHGAIEAEGGACGLVGCEEILLKPKENILVRPYSYPVDDPVLVHDLLDEENIYSRAFYHPTQDYFDDFAMEQTKVLHEGSLKVTNDKESTAFLFADFVEVVKGSTIDVSSPFGNGNVFIGGDYHGINPDIPNAMLTFIDQETLINANARENGDGGRVVIWADWATSFHGKVEACGGKHGGNGGLVQISGDAFLDFQGLVDTRAEKGCSGTLILNSH